MRAPVFPRVPPVPGSPRFPPVLPAPALIRWPAPTLGQRPVAAHGAHHLRSALSYLRRAVDGGRTRTATVWRMPRQQAFVGPGRGARPPCSGSSRPPPTSSPGSRSSPARPARARPGCSTRCSAQLPPAPSSAAASASASSVAASRTPRWWPPCARCSPGCRAPTYRRCWAPTPSDLGLLLPELGVRKEGPSDQARLIAAVSSVLDRAAELQPTVLVLDDLHCADVATLEVLAYLCAALDRQRLARRRRVPPGRGRRGARRMAAGRTPGPARHRGAAGADDPGRDPRPAHRPARRRPAVGAR